LVNMVSGAPVKGAPVYLFGPYQLPTLPSPADSSALPIPAEADSAGRFVFTGVRPGAYSLTVQVPGYVTLASGNPRKQIGMINVAPGQQVKDLVVKLAPYSVVTGQVADEDGAPVQNATVTLRRLSHQPGGRTSLGSAAPSVRTDDRGIYRLVSVVPNSYVLAVTPPDFLTQWRDKAGHGYAVTYSGEVAEVAAAAPFTIGLAETRTVNLRLKKIVTARIRGRLIAPNGLGRGPGVFSLLPRDSRISASGMLNGVLTANLADGTFEISGLPLGAYRLQATVTTSDERLAVVQPIDVNGDLDGVKIQLGRRITVRGIVTIEGDQHPGAVGSVNLHSLSGFLQEYLASTKPDLSFEAPEIIPAHYNLAMDILPPGCYVKAVRDGDQEIPVTGFEPRPGAVLKIILSTAGAARLDVATVDTNGRPGFLHSVTLIPLDGAAMPQDAMTDQEGRTAFWAAPGKYLATAWETDQRAAVLQSLGVEAIGALKDLSKVITLEPGGKASVQLTSVPAEVSRNAFAAR
jgi:hypothetical protein